MGLAPRKNAGLALALVVGAMAGVLVAAPVGSGQSGETLVGSMTLPNNNQDQTSSFQLQAGVKYRLEVSGTRDEHTGANEFPQTNRHQISDAFYCYEYTGTPESPEPCNTSSPAFYDAVRLTVNGQVRPLSTIDGQKPYSSNHVYNVSYTPSANGPLVARASTCGCTTTGNITITVYRQSSTTTTPTTQTETTPGTTTPGTDPGTGGGGAAPPWDGSVVKELLRPGPGRVGGVSSPPLGTCSVQASQSGQAAGCNNALVAVEGGGNSRVVVEGESKDNSAGKSVVSLLLACNYLVRRETAFDDELGIRALRELYKVSGLSPAEFCAHMLLDVITPEPPKKEGDQAAAGTCQVQRKKIHVRRKRGSPTTVVRRTRKRLRNSVTYTCATDDQGSLLLGISAPRGLRREFGKRLDLAVVTPRGTARRRDRIRFTFVAVP